LDVKEKKKRTEKMESQKRAQISQLIREEDKKVFAVKKSKEQLVQQRRVVANTHHMDQMAMLPDRDDISPGPADYANQVSSIDPTSGPTISDAPKPDLSQIPGTIDFQVLHAKSSPPVGTYNAKVLNNGSRPWEQQPTLTWSTSKKLSYIDEEVAGSINVPGPASYETAMSALTDMGVKIPREYIPKTDDRNREWLTGQVDLTLPSPTTYTVDQFTREQILAPQATEIPNFAPIFRSAIKKTQNEYEPPPSLNVSELDI
jgi:hypothetical protein